MRHERFVTSLSPMSLRDAYDPERFRADGHRLIDTLAEAMTRSILMNPLTEPSDIADLLDHLRALCPR